MSAAFTSDAISLPSRISPWTRRTGPRASARLEIFRPSSDHVVERDDFDATLVAQEVDDMRADEAGAAGDQNSFSLQISQDTLLLLSFDECQLR